MASFVPPGQPGDLDAASQMRVARSFYVVRMVRLSLLGVVAAGSTAASAVTDAPGWATVVFGVLTVLTLSSVWQTRRRWRAWSSAPSGT